MLSLIRVSVLIDLQHRGQNQFSTSSDTAASSVEHWAGLDWIEDQANVSNDMSSKMVNRFERRGEGGDFDAAQ